jgi:chemosensory pili system protein ChpA (sensor histidine kinase/response regulator)
VKKEFDTGPLSWVKKEIEFALTRADEGIVAFSITPDDHDTLAKTALPPLHQVSGALRMVGLEPAGRVVGAVEKLVGLLGCGDLNSSNEVINAVRGAIRALNRYLGDLMRGEPNRPLTLFPAYSAVVSFSGGGKVSETDLFYPDLSLSPSFDNEAEGVTSEEITKTIALKRTEFQRGILNLLRTNDYQKSLGTMAGALAAIDKISPVERRPLWWIATGFLEGLVTSTTPPDVFYKQICGRIDLQIKRQMEGGTEIPEGFARELLFSIAHMHPTSNRIREIQETYYLSSLLPRTDSPENTRVMLFLRDIREQVEAAKETWISLASGNASSAAQFGKQTAQLNDLARSFIHKSLQSVFANLAEVGANLSSDPRKPSDTLALETATSLLVARDALDSYPHLDPSLERLADAVVLRVTAALKEQASPDEGSGKLTDIFWEAREKQLFAQLGQEMHTNLNRIEEALDTFFREPAKRTELAALTPLVKQLHGAFVLLEMEDAALTLKKGGELVQKFSSGAGTPDSKDTELTADVFSNVGLVVSALQQGQENPNEVLRPLLERLGISLSRQAAHPA